MSLTCKPPRSSERTVDAAPSIALSGQALENSSREADLPEVVYTPESALRKPAILVRAMFTDLLASRELAWRMFVRDTKAAYRQSLLGYMWILAPPLASTFLFVFLQSQKILNVAATDVPYPVFVLTGMVLWEAFASALNAPLSVVSSSLSMLSKLNFPREALLLTSLYQVVFTLSIKLVLLAGVFLWFGVVPAWTVVFAPAGLLSLVALGFVLGLLLVPLGVLYQDVGRGIAMMLGAWMLVTPVIYPPPAEWPAALINTINPVSPLLTTTREWLTTGSPTQPVAFTTVSLVVVALLLVGWILYRLAMPHLVARMSA
ncbi:MAG: ABC transporter permease [Planctomycetota bacterium]